MPSEPLPWLIHHETGSIMERKPTDDRGIELMRQCGYNWIDRRDGKGWRKIKD